MCAAGRQGGGAQSPGLRQADRMQAIMSTVSSALSKMAASGAVLGPPGETAGSFRTCHAKGERSVEGDCVRARVGAVRGSSAPAQGFLRTKGTEAGTQPDSQVHHAPPFCLRV